MVANNIAAFDATHNNMLGGAGGVDACFTGHVIEITELSRMYTQSLNVPYLLLFPPTITLFNRFPPK